MGSSSGAGPTEGYSVDITLPAEAALLRDETCVGPPPRVAESHYDYIVLLWRPYNITVQYIVQYRARDAQVSGGL